MPEDNKKQEAAPLAKPGQVVKTAEGRKYVVGKEHPLPSGATIVAESPHADGDFSYVCGSDYCRCIS
jgi:hypothetical protein